MIRLIKYIVYWLFTQDERTRYQAGLSKGMHCISIEHGIAGVRCRYTHGKPKREYVTWKEYKERNK